MVPDEELTREKLLQTIESIVDFISDPGELTNDGEIIDNLIMILESIGYDMDAMIREKAEIYYTASYENRHEFRSELEEVMSKHSRLGK